MSDREELSRRVASVKRVEEVEIQTVSAGTAARTQVLLGERDGMPNFAMRRFIMGEGGGMPRHTNSVEHEQYVLKGKANVGIGDRIHQVTAGNVLYIPAGIPHYYEVVEAPFEFLCMVPNQPDEIRLVEESD
jgi:quercetin dioxygenase-like cupin family protein